MALLARAAIIVCKFAVRCIAFTAGEPHHRTLFPACVIFRSIERACESMCICERCLSARRSLKLRRLADRRCRGIARTQPF